MYQRGKSGTDKALSCFASGLGLIPAVGTVLIMDLLPWIIGFLGLVEEHHDIWPR